MKKRRFIRNLICWINYRKRRKEQARRAASLATRLVLNGCLTTPRRAGAMTSLSSGGSIMEESSRFQALARRGGTA